VAGTLATPDKRPPETSHHPPAEAGHAPGEVPGRMSPLAAQPSTALDTGGGAIARCGDRLAGFDIATSRHREVKIYCEDGPPGPSSSGSPK